MKTGIAITFAFCVFISAALIWVGFRFDITGSLNNNLFIKSNQHSFNVGDYILFCPTEVQNATASFQKRQLPIISICDNRIYPYIKRVVNIGGSTITREGSQLYIDQTPLGNPLPDSLRAAPTPSVVGDDLVYVVGDSPLSNDSRLYGGISPTQIVSIMKPLD